MDIDDTYRFLPGIVEGFAIGLDDLALDLVGPSTVVADAACSQIDVDIGHSQSLAVVERFNGSESACMFFHQIGQVGKIASSCAGVDLAPFALKSLAGCRDGDVDIFLRRFMDSDDGFFVCRVDGLKGLAVGAFDPFVIDEAEPRLLAKCYAWVGHSRFSKVGQSIMTMVTTGRC